MADGVELAAGELEAVVQGGALLSVAALRHRGEEMLVAPEALPPAYRVHGVRAGITLLHPWANRLGADRFVTAGAEVVLDDEHVGREPAGLALHGLAIPGTWAAEAVDDATARTTAGFAAHAAFPWPHELEVVVEIASPARLSVTTTVRAPAGGDPVPVAFGWHPYFALPGAPRAGWRLELPEREHVGVDNRGLPDGTSRPQAPEFAPLAERTFDDGYSGLPEVPTLAVDGGGRRIAIAFTAGYPFAQVFAPGDRDVVSLEPMTGPTDALRTGRDLRFATPGEPYVARFVVDVEPA